MTHFGPTVFAGPNRADGQTHVAKIFADARCTHPSPLPALTEPTCNRPAGHEPPHRFTSHDNRTDLEQMPTAKELAR